jgi:cytochrome P450
MSTDTEPARASVATATATPVAPIDRRYDPFVTEWRADPQPIYASLLAGPRVTPTARPGVWAVPRFADVQSLARDWQRFSSFPSADLDNTADVLGPHFMDSDPPSHTRMRNVIRHRFGPREITRTLAQTATAHATHLLRELADRGPVIDLGADFAWPLAVAMISELLGIPAEEATLLRGWIQGLARREPGDSVSPPDAVAAATELAAYLAELVATRIAQPTDDVLGDLAQAAARGDMAPEEVAATAAIICLAGTETTQSSITNALVALAGFPDQRARLRSDPALIPAAVEELLRYDGPVRYTARRALTDVSIDGVDIPAEDRVLLLWACANRDADRFAEPDRLDLDRPKLRNLAFGEGIHHCLGAPRSSGCSRGWGTTSSLRGRCSTRPTAPAGGRGCRSPGAGGLTPADHPG